MVLAGLLLFCTALAVTLRVLYEPRSWKRSPKTRFTYYENGVPVSLRTGSEEVTLEIARTKRR